MFLLLCLILPALVSMLAVKWVFFKVLNLAKLKALVDNPNARKLQKEPVPVLGGMAVFFGLIVGMMFAISMVDCSSLSPLVLSGSIMFIVGMLDDFVGLSPQSRIVIEVFTITCLVLGTGVGIDNLMGMWGYFQLPVYVALPLTVFAGVGIINAVNMIDGVNGLSSGLCIMASLIFAHEFYNRGDYANCVLGLCLAASLWVFLLHNVFGVKSKMYIGDSGTMLMGIIMVWFVMNLLNTAHLAQHQVFAPNLNLVALALAIESVPVFDTLRVMTMRMQNGKSPFSPDRTHLHHKFIDMGVSHSGTSLSMISINMMIVAVVFISYNSGASLENQLYSVIAAGMILVWGSFWFLNYHATHQNFLSEHLNRISMATHFGQKRWWQYISTQLDSGELPLA